MNILQKENLIQRNKMRTIDLIGKKFGKLTVMQRVGYTDDGRITWLCKCDCGNEKIIAGSSLTTKNRPTKSCGCLKKNSGKIQIHGHALKGKVSRTYTIWLSMKRRCFKIDNKDYKDYGGRGITICNRWLEPDGKGFINFLEDMGECPKGKSLNRVKNDLLINGYSPVNCCWSTQKEQSRNKRNNLIITYNGKTQCLMDWSIELNINYDLLRRRIYRDKWSIERAFTTPERNR